MDHKIKVSSNTATTSSSRSILIPQKKNIKFDFYEDNHHTACATTDSSRKKEKVAVSKKVVTTKSTNAVISSSRRKVDHNPIVMIPSITTTMIIDESKRKDIAVDKAVVSDFMVEAFQEYFKSNIQPDSTIFYERIMEEIVRIRRRANVLLSDEQRHEMIRLALAMDVTKLARKIVNENKELMHESVDHESSFLTAGISSDMMMVSIDNSDNDDNHDNDAQFCKAFDEVERIRKRIIQQASVPFSANNTDSITVATTSNDDREPSITLDSQSIFRDYGDDHDEDHLTVSSNISNHICPNINTTLLKPSVTELEHPSQPSWTYLEPSTEKQFDTEDLSFFGTFKFEFLNNTNSGSSLIDGTSSSSSSSSSSLIEYLPITQSNRPITDQSINCSARGAKMKSRRNENLHNNKKLNQNHTNDYSDGITTSSFSPRGNREVALSLDSIIGSRSTTSEASRTTDKLSSELSYLILRQQLEAAVTPQKDKGSYHYPLGGGFASSAPLLNDSHSTTDHQFSTVNDLFSSKQLLTTSSTSSSSSSSVVVQSDLALDKNDFDTTLQLVQNTCTIKSSSSPSPSASKKKSRIAIALATMDTPHHGGQSSLPINNNIDHPSSPPHNSRVGGKADIIHPHNSIDNSDNTNTSGKQLYQEQSSKLDKHRKQLTHNSSNPVKKNYYFDSVDSITHESDNRLTMEARDDYIKYKSHYHHNANINSIDDGVDAIISSSSSSVSKQLQFGAKLLLSSPMTSWIPAHMHRSRDNDSKVLSRNSSAISLEQKKLSLEELPMLLESDDVGGRRKNHDDDGLYTMMHHGVTTAIVDKAKGNEGDMDNVYKSLQLLNDHLSQFQSSVVVEKCGCDDDDCNDNDDNDEIRDVKRKVDNISRYDDNGHVIVPPSDLDDDNDIDDNSNVKQVHEQYHECKGQTMQYKKNKKTQLHNNDLHVSNRDDVVVTSSNSSSSETTTSGNRSRMEKEQKSRVRRQIEESIRFNTQQTQLQQVPPSHNHSHHHIHQQQGHDSKSGQLQLRRMGALAAALDAGDAVGKLMAEMLISSR